MWDIDNVANLPDDFTGKVRLFPLPNLVMFPHVVQPLHIFEPRYREMLAESLATDRLIAMALLQPGWEADYEGRPPVYPTTCVGRVASHAQLDEGKYNILLMGVRRAKVIEELPPDQPFREAEVAVLEDHYPKSGSHQRAGLQRELLRCFGRFAPESPAAQEQFETLMSNKLPLGVLADVISFTMKFELDFKQRLLSESNVDTRAGLLLDQLRELTRDPTDDGNETRPFPPDFSAN
jgi:ATP-dependent Lon protease